MEERGARRTAALLAALTAAAIATGSPYVHAHRGGSLVTVDGEQRPRYAENTMPAFRDAAARGFVLELDVKLTADWVAVVTHDASLDRTTDCEGRVDSFAFAELRSRCEVDLLGTEDHTRRLRRRDQRRARVPSLRQVLALARRHGSAVNLEVKNQPGHADFDHGSGFATAVAAAIKSTGFPPSRLIVQSFWPSNLDVFEADQRRERRCRLVQLGLGQQRSRGRSEVRVRGYEWVSPAWPVSPAYVSNAHALGLQTSRTRSTTAPRSRRRRAAESMP